MPKYLVILEDHDGKEIHRFVDALTVPPVGDLITLGFGKTYQVFRRNWGATDKTFGEVVHVTLSEIWKP